MNQITIKAALLVMQFEKKQYPDIDPDYEDYEFRQMEVTLHKGKIHRVSVCSLEGSVDFPGCNNIAKIRSLKKMLYEK